MQTAVISAFLRHTALVTFAEYPASNKRLIISSRSIDRSAPMPIAGELLNPPSTALDGGAAVTFGLTAFSFLTSMESFGCWLCDECSVPPGGASETWSTSPERRAVSTPL